MEELNQFEQMILTALGSVHESYYQTTYQNIHAFRNALQHRRGRIVEGNFYRYGERVFCYELYHQLRILIDNAKQTNQNFLNGAILQGEVEKMQIIELIETLGLHPMDGEYAPDFLMHTPGNAVSHPFVIEVKCEHDITGAKIFADLKKINQFITQYNYQRGVFITTNAQPNYIADKILELNDNILRLDGRDRIKVVCKLNQNEEPQIWQL
ncbi:MAG: hypothetical protein JNK20_10005 [Flavipsychrobacter sp.]|nr:hypothetical protein [Flavipsychrobacter sp.]